MDIVYHIGRVYKYPNSRKLFKLIAVYGYLFVFECGHKVTDNVFTDLIDTSTGIQVYKNKQIELF